MEKTIHTIVYLRNRSLTLALKGITPYEAWYGTKPSVNHLQVFGSTYYAIVPKEKWTKLENHSIKFIVIGYSDENKDYQLLSSGKSIISRVLVFDETKI